MTKEEIINAVLNLDIIEIKDIRDYEIFAKGLVETNGAILSVCSNGVVVTFQDPYKGYAYSLTPFEEIKSIIYLKETTIE